MKWPLCPRSSIRTVPAPRASRAPKTPTTPLSFPYKFPLASPLLLIGRLTISLSLALSCSQIFQSINLCACACSVIADEERAITPRGGCAGGAGGGTEDGSRDLRGEGAEPVPSSIYGAADSVAWLLREAEGAAALPVRIHEGSEPQEVLEQPQRQEDLRRLRRSIPTPVLIYQMSFWNREKKINKYRNVKKQDEEDEEEERIMAAWQLRLSCVISQLTVHVLIKES